jgi:hypothetical protein
MRAQRLGRRYATLANPNKHHHFRCLLFYFRLVSHSLGPNVVVQQHFNAQGVLLLKVPRGSLFVS